MSAILFEAAVDFAKEATSDVSIRDDLRMAFVAGAEWQWKRVADTGAEIERLREAHDLIADWLVEGTEDLPDLTPVTIKIGSRSTIFDELKNLRSALKEQP